MSTLTGGLSIATSDEKELRQEIQLACFKVGSELYALDIMKIKEIIRPQKLTPIPKAPSFIEGVINLRGVVIPVADMRKRFDQPSSEVNSKNRVVVCSLGGRMIGLLVDEVTGVKRYGRKEIAPAPQFIKGPQAAYFLGVARCDDDLIMLIDLEKILSSDEKIELQKLAHD
ncbi:MAG: chemotaxis protein CheW [Candidatus Marinimicrobia bacterium]|nr:chemotaxis protein CheW [Candidatus Neomarinimicrobiota bacterium]